jgi:hypothetical protein
MTKPKWRKRAEMRKEEDERRFMDGRDENEKGREWDAQMYRKEYG